MKNYLTLAFVVSILISVVGCANGQMASSNMPPQAEAEPEEDGCNPDAPGYDLCLRAEKERRAKLAAPPPAVGAPKKEPAPVEVKEQPPQAVLAPKPAPPKVLKPAAPPPPQIVEAPPPAAPPPAALKVAAAPPPAGPPVQYLPGMPAANAVAPCSLAEHNMLTVTNSTDFALAVYGLVQRVSGTVTIQVIESNNRSRAVAWVIVPHGEARFCFVDPTSLPPQIQSTLPAMGQVEYVAYEERGPMFPAKAKMRMGFRYPVPRQRGNWQRIDMGLLRYYRN